MSVKWLENLEGKTEAIAYFEMFAIVVLTSEKENTKTKNKLPTKYVQAFYRLYYLLEQWDKKKNKIKSNNNNNNKKNAQKTWHYDSSKQNLLPWRTEKTNIVIVIDF